MAVVWKATIRGIVARRVRLLLTAVAVMLGVAFVTGTFVLTDTMRQAYDDVFDRTYSGVDIVVRAAANGGQVGLISSGVLSPRQRMPDSIVETVRDVDGVGTADGVVVGYAQFVDKHGESIQNGLLPTLGTSWPASDDVGPLRLLDDGRSRPPQGAGEVVMDVTTAREHGFAVGDRVRVLLQEPIQVFTIVGIFEVGGAADLGGLTYAAFDLATAQQVLGAQQAVDAVYVTAGDDTTDSELRTELEDALGPGYDVESAAAVADEAAAPVHQLFGLFSAALLGFAAVGLVVGGFIIFNTFSILVAQRTRELGLLRAMGASDRQVLGSVILEAAAVGAVASVAGIALGVALARTLLRTVDAFGFEAGGAGAVLLGRTMLLALGVGFFVTVGSALFPAVRAARISPVAAIHDLARTTVVPLRRRALVGGALTVLGLIVLTVGLTTSSRQLVQRMVVTGLGTFAVFLGAVVLIATFARPLARFVGWPLAWWLGVTGALARGNAMRNPRRTAATASALVVGLSLVCLVAVFAASTKASLRQSIDGGIRADYVLTTKQLTGFDPEVGERVRGLPAVEAATGLRLAQLEVGGTPEFLVAADPEALPEVVDLGHVEGDVDGIAGGGVLLQEDEAAAYDAHIGEPITITLAGRGSIPIEVVGTYSQPSFLGGFPVPTFLVSDDTYAASFGSSQQDALVFVKARTGQVDAARRQIEDALGDDFPNIKVRTRAQFRERQEHAVDQFLTVLVALLLMSELIAVLGIINTLFLSVYERTRELGLLRAVGMSRRQVRRVIRGESLIIAVIGGIVGIVVGVFWGWGFTEALAQQGISEFRVPPVQVAVFFVLSVVAGVVAALLPAWRAGRLDVLEAIAEE